MLCAALPAAPAMAATTVATANTPLRVTEQRNFLLTQPLVTADKTIPAGTRISSYLVAIEADAGAIAFDKPVLAVITDETEFADTSRSLGQPLAKPEISLVALSDLAAPQQISFTTSGTTLAYQRSGTVQDPSIVRVITAAVPEPGTWAMLIAGFGLVGTMMRRRQRQLLSA
ncbi:MAG: PEPxxWA-CTERM sorting domain-containing protein [Polymorphobacter sp.]|uniref:PEPxxWA-CTERM sorting domain-containing protein n=1 Tax=Polymorphobacter sp. TaxID=1909290 RepID=UPI003A8A030D